MARSRDPGFQGPILFASLLCGAAAFYPAWYHHDVFQQSDFYPTTLRARHWAEGEAAARHCLRASIDVQVQVTASTFADRDKGPWFATLRCNTPRVFGRLAAIFILPYLTILFVVRLMRRAR